MREKSENRGDKSLPRMKYVRLLYTQITKPKYVYVAICTRVKRVFAIRDRVSFARITIACRFTQFALRFSYLAPR